MLRRALLPVLAVCFHWLSGGVISVAAQGLIWELPAEGEWVRYEGTYKQTDFRPNTPGGGQNGDVTAEWIRHLTLKSLNREQAEFAGEMVPCRWLEIKVITGKAKEGLDPGPVGTRIFKVLVPESRVIAGQVDSGNIPVSFLPIVDGYRKIGNREALQLQSGALQIYPLISLLMHYDQLTAQGETADPGIPLGPVTATKFVGLREMERPISRSKNEATLWRSTDVPFGLAKWEVTMNRYTKERNDARKAFIPVSQVVVEMHAVDRGTGAQTELDRP